MGIYDIPFNPAFFVRYARKRRGRILNDLVFLGVLPFHFYTSQTSVFYSSGLLSARRSFEKKVSDLFIPLLPTAFDAIGSFCFYFFFIKPL